MDDPFLTVHEVAELLRVNQQTVRNWIDRGQLAGVRAGARRVRVRRSDLEAFIEANTTAARSGSEEAPGQPLKATDEWKEFGIVLDSLNGAYEQQDRDRLLVALGALTRVSTNLRRLLRAGER